MAEEPLVIGIETSCDETGVGIVAGHRLLANTIASSADEHARFGGIVPEVASRAHLEAMVPTLERACSNQVLTQSLVDRIYIAYGAASRARPLDGSLDPLLDQFSYDCSVA